MASGDDNTADRLSFEIAREPQKQPTDDDSMLKPWWRLADEPATGDLVDEMVVAGEREVLIEGDPIIWHGRIHTKRMICRRRGCHGWMGGN
jgi:hypothetical protein